MTRTTAVGGFLLALVACSALGTTSAQLKKKLVGVSGLELRKCIGVPARTSVDGASEFLTYRWAIEDQESAFVDPEERVRRRGRVNPIDGTPGSLDPFDTSADPGDELRVPRRGREKLGYCELIFELREGHVHGVEAEGRTSEGLNRDTDCLVRTRRCIPPDSPQS